MFRVESFFTLENCLFGVVSLTKSADIDKYKYSGYRIGFDRKDFFSIGNEVGRNLITFGIDMSSYPHIDNKGKDILILGKGPIQGLSEYLLTAARMYLINFTEHSKKVLFKLAV